VNQREAMKRLLERSSLGTPGARSLRARTDPAAVRRVMERVRKGGVNTSMAPLRITCDASHDHDSRDCLVEFFLGNTEAEASITPLRITCGCDSPNGSSCDCLVEFFLGNTEAGQSTEPAPIGTDLQRALDTLSTAGLEPRVRSNRRSTRPDRESKAG
jgi:hypothetical protein